MASLVTPRSITHDIEESNVATRRRATTEGTEEAVAATAAEVTETAVVMEVEVMVERPRPRPRRR